MLTIDPLCDAIAAGNTAFVKTSAYLPATSEVVKKIIEECFNEEFVAVVMGGRKENAVLLSEKQKPLALYIFSENNYNIDKITKEYRFGGGINDVVIHLAASEMGFDGVGERAMGQYRQKRVLMRFHTQKVLLTKRYGW